MNIISPDLVTAYTAFNDTAVALRSATLLDARTAADRLEDARKAFQDHFMVAIQVQAAHDKASNKVVATPAA
ncbi:hypothetical protein [Duganella vulcania]|uniref:Uncharacterized protein n=1 Tax=Duganella vulcania TaxID=2692166 RepID=A0A845GI94_9BURK|nr:hypothetical protein [Duganella vulcania]MYM92389.1 hypothetical protein [Duganella vulcania]